MTNHLSKKMLLGFIFLCLLLISPTATGKVWSAPSLQSSDITVDIRIFEGEHVVAPGGTVGVEIEGKNTSRSAIDGITVKVEYDAGTVRISGVQANDGRGWVDSSPLGENGELVWEGVSLSPNQSWRGRYTATMAQPAQIDRLSQGEDSSLGKTSATRASISINGSEVGRKSLDLRIPVPLDTLQVSKGNETGAGIGPDGDVRLTLELKNKSSDLTFTNLSVVESFKAEFSPPIVRSVEIVDSSLVQGNPQHEIVDGQIFWRVDKIEPGGEWFVTYVAEINPNFVAGNREISNTAVLLIQSDAGEIPAAQADELSIPVSLPQLTLSREIITENESGEFRPGDSITYRLTYTIQGTGQASQVVIIETVDLQVFEEDLEINNDGQRSGNSIAWQLGDVPVGAVGEVSYKAQIKSDLYAIGTGSTENHSVSNRAILRAAGIADTSEANPQTVVIRAPVLRLVALKAEDLNGGEILPGDNIRVTIDISNNGAVAASSVGLSALYDEGVAIIKDISDGGISSDGQVDWTIDELPASGSKRVSYDLQINAEPEQTSESKIEAVVSLAGTDVARSSRTLTIQPRPLPTATPDPSANQIEASVFEQKNFEWMAILIGGLAVSALLVVSYQAWSLKEKHHFDTHFRDIVEMFTIIIIVVAVLILAMVSEIGSTPAVGVLSGIAGYVLGRGARR